MFKLKTNKTGHGFTTFELLIILAVVVVLGAVVLMEYSGVQQRSRDTERKKDIDALSLQVQIYEAQKDTYPTLVDLNNAKFIKANLATLDPANLQDPKSKSQVLVAIPKPNAYAYQPTPVGCDNAAAGNCTGYSLTATLEAGGTYVKSSL